MLLIRPFGWLTLHRNGASLSRGIFKPVESLTPWLHGMEISTPGKWGI